jgi:SAM-dependent methyltransferase
LRGKSATPFLTNTMSTDLFSGHASLYAAFRPTYPEDLYNFIFSHVRGRSCAWDCGTGNGQVARRLAQDFDRVCATDISLEQLNNATRLERIEYSVSAAEKTAFPSGSFDLITVAQALHWFNTDQFYAEARRVARKDSLIALWGYGHIMINDQVDPLVRHFYSHVVGKYWDDARRHVETEYRDIPFPFDEIQSPRFYIQQEWTIRHLMGYLESWSATQKYVRETNVNPLYDLEDELKNCWGGAESVGVRFPLFLKLGRIL